MESVCKTKLAWQRPSTIARPHIWDRINVKSKDGKSHRLRIQEIPEDRFEEVLTFMGTYSDNDEPIRRHFQVQQNEEIMKSFRKYRRMVLDQKVSIIATADEESPCPELVGCLLLLATSKDDQLMLYEGLEQISDVVTTAARNVDLFKWFDSDHHISGSGLCVAPQYRGMGIGCHLYSTVSKLAKAFQLPGFAALLSSAPSQAIAKKLGFTLLNKSELRHYRNKEGQLVFPPEDTRSVMLMGIKYT